MTLLNLYLFKMPYLQVRLHSEVLGVQTSTFGFWGGHNSVHNSTYNFQFYFIDICVLILTPLKYGKFLEGRKYILPISFYLP